MPWRPHLIAVVAGVLLASSVLLLAGCSGGSLPGRGGGSGTDAAELAEGTCWTGDLLGSDPQDTLRLSKEYDVAYPAVARAIAAWPSFSRRVPCDREHQVEVYKVLRLPELDQKLTGYGTLLRAQTPLHDTVSRSVARGCMSESLARAVGKAGLPGGVMEPVLPTGAALGWAPAPPSRWTNGVHEFACTLTWQQPASTRYAAVFTKHFPTGSRTCIDSDALVYVDCARPHDRERIAVIDAAEAVAAGAFPGKGAIRNGFGGRSLAVSDARYRQLDAACTAYLRAISSTKKLTGVANIDVDEWPAADGSYPIYCEADRSPDEKSLITQGSVYDRA
jgi:hypothetical protein